MSIGVAISTYNRERCLRDLVDTLPFDKLDYVVVVKDGGEEYEFNDKRVEFIDMLGNHGVSTSKNIGLAMLAKNNIEHMFLLDDDMIVKHDDAFDIYIKTALTTGVYHLLFSRFKNSEMVHSDDIHLDLWTRCCGAFMYVHKGVVRHVGDFDQRFVNAFEHIDFYYRCELAGLVPKFWYFPDVYQSDKYLMSNPHAETTIFGSNIDNPNIKRCGDYFTEKHGQFINEINKVSLRDALHDLSRIKKYYSRA